MTIKSHSRGSGGSHKLKKEDAKSNGMWRQLSDEEYEREKVDIEVHLGLLMGLLQEEEDHRCGWIMRKKLKWHKLRKKKEQLINVQWEDEVLKTSTKNDEEGQSFNYVQKDDGTVEFHLNEHAQMNGSASFHHTVKVKSKKDLAYDDGQEMAEKKEDSNHSYFMLEEVEEKGSKNFLSHVKELEQPKKNLMIGPSNETIGSCSFEIDNLSVFSGVVEGSSSFGVVLNEVEDFQTKYDEEILSDEDQAELLQQKKFIDFLLNNGNISEEDETIMSRMEELVVAEDME
jgi:hypothetical protein